tara:strand:- start:3118 stop:3597 length:480 start_codon:yes stop_codon:yes gene_type:complete
MTAFNQAWDILKMRFRDFQDKAKGMQDDIKHRYAREKGNPRMMPSHEQDTVNQSIVDRLVHDNMQENMQQGRVGEQTTDALASNRPLFVPRFDARAIHPKFTVRQDIQDKMPYSMSDLYTDKPPINYYDPANYAESPSPTLTEKDMEMLRRFDTNKFNL